MNRRATDEYGAPIGQAHRNPMLDTPKFEVELKNGETEKIMADQISANIYSQLEYDGREIFQFKGIIDHKKDGYVLTKETGFTVLQLGHKKYRPTTRIWKVLVEWRDETTTWMDLKYVKEASPIELAEYAVANKIYYDPDFAWWVHYFSI